MSSLKLRMLSALLIALVLGLGSLSGLADAGEREWEWLAGKDGIHIWKREQAGHEMPGFRGQVYIEGTVDDVLTHMLDWKRHTEWMYGCAESTLLKQINEDHAIMYNRTAAPWPVWDRDVIADTEIKRSSDGKAVTVDFKNIESELRPIPRHVVRLPLLVGFYKLWQVEPRKVKVLYQLEADLGGSIPRWLAIKGAKAMPWVTLDRLRARVEGRED